MATKQLRIEIGFGLEQDREHNKVTDVEQKLHRIKNEAVNSFGAYTYYDSQGGWRHSDGKLAVEKGGTILTFQDDAPGIREKVVKFAHFCKAVLNQEAVAVGVTSSEFACV